MVYQTLILPGPEAATSSPCNDSSPVTIYKELASDIGVTFVQSILVLCRVGETDAGQYSCNVASNFGNRSSNYRLTVNVGGKHTIIYIDSSD